DRYEDARVGAALHAHVERRRGVERDLVGPRARRAARLAERVKDDDLARAAWWQHQRDLGDDLAIAHRHEERLPFAARFARAGAAVAPKSTDGALGVVFGGDRGLRAVLPFALPARGERAPCGEPVGVRGAAPYALVDARVAQRLADQAHSGGGVGARVLNLHI